LEFYVKELVLPLHKFDEKYSKIIQNLSFLLDNTPTNLDPNQQQMAHFWFLKKKQKYSQRDLQTTSQSIVKQSSKDLKRNEYFGLIRTQLQMIIWLEIIRINKETNTKIPDISLTKTRPKKLLMPLHFETSIISLMDKLLISTMTSEDFSIWKDFIDPIITRL
jgi:hypothetical protein